MYVSPGILIIIGIVLIKPTNSHKLDIGLKWGQKCKIPGSNEYLKPSEECEMSKGLTCQVYQQGNLCGCLIRSSLSFDEYSGECRRKPGHHCPYVNLTMDPGAYDNFSYNHKCHSRAECMIIDPMPDSGTSKKTRSAKKEQFAVCRCKPGYKESRDGLVCHSVNIGARVNQNILLLQSAVLLVLAKIL